MFYSIGVGAWAVVVKVGFLPMTSGEDNDAPSLLFWSTEGDVSEDDVEVVVLVVLEAAKSSRK